MPAVLEDDQLPIVVSRTILVTPEDPDGEITNHQYANATIITGTSYTGAVDTATSPRYHDPETLPPGVVYYPSSGDGYYAAWWVWTPAASGSTIITGRADQGITVYIYAVTGNTWTLLRGTRSQFSGGPFSFTVDAVAGTKYYVRLSGYYEIETKYAITLDQAAPPPANDPVLIVAPAITAVLTMSAKAVQPHLPVPAPITVTVRSRKPKVSGDVGNLDVPALAVTISAAPASTLRELTVPPITRGLRQRPPSLIDVALTLSSPEQDEVITTGFPQFMIGLLSAQDDETAYVIEAQYATDAAFADATTVTLPVTVADGGATFVPDTALTGYARASTFYWRARLLSTTGEVIIDYGDAISFTVDATVTAASIPVTFDVVEDGPRPIHLWHFDPPGGEVGEPLTAYGQGFPGQPGNVTVGGVPADIISWELIPAIADADRIIDGDYVTCEHYEVVFTVPEIDEPGGPALVEA